MGSRKLRSDPELGQRAHQRGIPWMGFWWKRQENRTKKKKRKSVPNARNTSPRQSTAAALTRSAWRGFAPQPQGGGRWCAAQQRQQPGRQERRWQRTSFFLIDKRFPEKQAKARRAPVVCSNYPSTDSISHPLSLCLSLSFCPGTNVQLTLCTSPLCPFDLPASLCRCC